jgi:D-alanine-D-alanine ligase
LVFNLVESLGGTDRLMTLAPLLLEALDTPYTGATSHSMLAVADKRHAKQILHDAGLPTPGWFTCDEGWHVDPLPRDRTAGAAAGPTRLIVKAVWEHASFELHNDAVIEVPGQITNGELAERLQARTAAAGRPLFVERFIDGREFNLSLLAGRHGPQVLPPAEIDFSAFPPDQPHIVGYPAKWDEGSFQYLNTPRRFEFARSDRPLLERLKQLAIRCWHLFRLRGYARVDLRVDAAGRPWILEINVNPCLSLDAGFAAALQRADIDYDEAIERILADTSCPSVTDGEIEDAGCFPQRRRAGRDA